MRRDESLAEYLLRRGVTRRGFLKFCAATASMMALSPSMASQIASALEKAKRPSVIWLSFQECTGCTESLTRAHNPTVESLILDAISLDYHHTLQAAAGTAAEEAREHAMQEFKDKYILVVDGSIPTKLNGAYSTIAGMTNLQMLQDAAKHAAAIIAVGSCASFGGIPHANPNPTGAVSVMELIKDKPIINVPGCPPVPAVIAGVLAHYLTFNTIPPLDDLHRPLAFFGDTIHERCYRRNFYDEGKFAKSFDDEGARNGWCLFELGCKGPTTHNACATTKWNNSTSFPIESGHPCIGCSEPDFWDAGSFYTPLSAAQMDARTIAGVAIAAGVGAGVAYGLYDHQKRKKAKTEHEKVTVKDMGEGA